MSRDFQFSIIITASDFEDALEIYRKVLSAKVKSNAGASLSHIVGNETKILSLDSLKKESHYDEQKGEFHRLQ